MKSTVGSIASYRPLGNSKARRRADWEKFLRLAREVRSLDGALREEVGPVPVEYHLGRVQRERIRRSEKTAVLLPEGTTESKQSIEMLGGSISPPSRIARFRSGLAGARATSAGTTIQPALVSRG
jgi:hypothetical protein